MPSSSAATSPPTITIAKGRCESEPIPRESAAGNKPKLIDEYIGQLNSGTHPVSVAHMRSPSGWVEPGQTPDFDEYTLVLNGMLRVEYRDEGAEPGAEVMIGELDDAVVFDWDPAAPMTSGAPRYAGHGAKGSKGGQRHLGPLQLVALPSLGRPPEHDRNDGHPDEEGE